MIRHSSRSSKPNRHWHQPEWHARTTPSSSRPMCSSRRERPKAKEKGKGRASKRRAKAEAVARARLV
eukprot:1913107-Lingulodinium_polyedra.AAC.1